MRSEPPAWGDEKRSVLTVDARLALIAGRAHGVASRGELLAAGLSEDQIDRRVAARSLIVECPR